MKALKELGQNFLNDASIAREIAVLGSIQAGDPVWEIGPGLGILTDEIIKFQPVLTLFELDRRLGELLANKYQDCASVRMGDILRVDWEKEISESKQKIKVVSNIPYQITSPLLYHFEKYSIHFARIVLMVQKEVAERLAAKAGTKAYGVLTLRLNIKFDISNSLQVNKEYFDPIPKVDSAVVVLTPRLNPPHIVDIDTFYRIVIAAFAHRRKTLRNNLYPILGKEPTSKLEKVSGIDFSRRGETLDEAEFIRLSDCLASL